MVIRVYLLGTKLTTEDLDSTVGDDFVGVHVRLGSRTSLPDDKREVIVEFTFDNFVASLNHGISNIWLKTKVQVGLCGTLFKKTKSFDDRKRHTFAFTSNLEVLERSLGLSAPVTISWYLDGTKCIRFFSELLSGGK